MQHSSSSSSSSQTDHSSSRDSRDRGHLVPNPIIWDCLYLQSTFSLFCKKRILNYNYLIENSFLQENIWNLANIISGYHTTGSVFLSTDYLDFSTGFIARASQGSPHTLSTVWEILFIVSNWMEIYSVLLLQSHYLIVIPSTESFFFI